MILTHAHKIVMPVTVYMPREPQRRSPSALGLFIFVDNPFDQIGINVFVARHDANQLRSAWPPLILWHLVLDSPTVERFAHYREVKV